MKSTKEPIEYENVAKETVDLIREKLLNEEGLLIWGRSKEEQYPTLIVDDFGDVAPFIAMYGGEDICKVHLDYVKNNIHNLGFKRAFAYTDLLLGLIWYGRLGVYKEQARHLSRELASVVETIWYRGPRLYSIREKNILLPITNGIDSTFIEVWTEMYRETREKKYRELAERTFEYFREIYRSYSHGLIPVHHVGAGWVRPITILFRKKFSKINVMKDNTNFLFGLLDMIRLDILPDEARHSFDEIHSRLSELAKTNTLNNTLVPDMKSDLLCSFAFIDLSCDAYSLLGDDSYLKPAVMLADYWLSLPKNKTGLFPRNYSSTETYFDSETDMAVALLKLYECVGDSKYRHKAQELATGLLKYHKKGHGYVTLVDINTGEIVSETVKTKFVALFIKLLHLLKVNKPIYSKKQLFMLAKDR